MKWYFLWVLAFIVGCPAAPVPQDVDASEDVQEDVSDDSSTTDAPKTGPGSIYGSFCRPLEQLTLSDPPPDLPACTGCIEFRSKAAAAQTVAPALTAPLYERVLSIEDALNSVGPLVDDKGVAAHAFAAPVSGGEYEDILSFIDPQDAYFFGYASLVQVDKGGISMPERLDLTLDVGWCLASVDLGGAGPEKELICTDERDNGDKIFLVYHSTPGGYVEDPNYKTEIPMGGQAAKLPNSATVVDLSGDGRPEIVLTRFGSPNTVLCQTDDLVFVDCTASIGYEPYDGATFFVAAFPCNPASLGTTQICLFEANDFSDAQKFTYRVVRSELDLYGFHLERFDPLAQTPKELENQSFVEDICDRMSVISCPDWLGIDEPCPDWLYENMKSFAGGDIDDSLLTLGALDGSGQTNPMGFGCSIFANDQLCCVISEVAGPSPDLTLCHQGGDTWRMVHGIGLTKRPTAHGHLTEGWGVAWISTGRWEKDLIMVNGDDTIESEATEFIRIILGGLVPGYEENSLPGPAYVGYYRRLPNLALSEQSEVAGLTAGSGDYGTVSELWLPSLGGSLFQHLFFGKWSNGFNVFRLKNPEGNMVRLRLFGDDGSDRTGMLSRIEVTDGTHTCVSFLGTESAQVYLGTRYDTTCGVGTAEMVDVTVQWFPSTTHPNGHTSAYKDVPADGIMTILRESGGWLRDPKAL